MDIDQNELLLLGSAAETIKIIITAVEKKKKIKRKSRVWVRDWKIRRLEGKGILTMLNDELLSEDPSAYRNFLRMDNKSFKKLLNKVEESLRKQNTMMRESISAQSRLETTLRFLATGESYRSLMYSTRIDETTISKFVPIVCNIIYQLLKNEYLKTPNETEAWIEIADNYEKLWQFPNCLGALDGRHIKFRAPISAGSYYYNYKGDHSIVLLGMVDAMYKFVYYNVGVNGRVSDGGVFRESGLCKSLSTNRLNFPPDRKLPGQIVKTPYVIIADEAFPLSTRIMKPYPSKGLSHDQKIFNYRLSRARRMIESAFGILANRFRILINPIHLCPEKVESITLACITLHNFLASENWRSYTDQNEAKDIHPQMSSVGSQGGNRYPTNALEIRENFKNYFNSEAGSVEWQENAVLRNNM